jgi:hypothetical protein
MQRAPRAFDLITDDLPGSFISVIGAKEQGNGRPVLEVGPDQTREFRVLVTEYGGVLKASTVVRFAVRDLKSGETATASDYFRSPETRR